MSVTKFAFLSPNSAGAIIHIFPLTLCYPLSGDYAYNTLPLVVTYQKAGRRATKPPDSITTPVYDCLWNNARGRTQDTIILAPHHLLLTASPYRLPGGPSGKGKWKSLSRVWLFATPWAIQSMEFSRPEYWSGSLSLLLGLFPTQGSNPGLQHCRKILYQLSHKGSPPACKCRRYKRCGFNPGCGRSPGEGHDNSLQYPCLENPMDGGAWRAMVHSVAQSQTRLRWLSTHPSSLCFLLPCFRALSNIWNHNLNKYTLVHCAPLPFKC